MRQGIQVGFILSILFLFCLKVAWASPEKAGLYLSFEQRLAMTYALAEYGAAPERKQEISNKVKFYLSTLSQNPVQVIQVKTFDAFLKHYRGEWPETNSVDLDLAIIEKQGIRPIGIYKAGSAHLQRQIDDYINWNLIQIKGLILSGSGLTNLIDGLRAISSFDREALIDRQVQGLKHASEKIASMAFENISDPATRISMEVLLQEYFSRLGLNSKKLILSDFLGGDLLSSDMKKFEVMVQNSGPQFQKLLQVMTRQAGIPVEVIEVFRRLESSVRPVPRVQVRELINAEKNNYQFSDFEEKPLGIGTMAQVHRAKIIKDGVQKDVVTRFIKPDIDLRVQEDERILTEIAQILDARKDYRATGAPPLGPLIADLTATVQAELSQQETVERQKMAQLVYNKDMIISDQGYKNILQIHVPEIYESLTPSKLMVQEMVLGQKLDKEAVLYADIAPNLKRLVVENLAYVWAKEVFFGGGFFHSDLHQGNLLLKVTEKNIRLSILDYGMGGRISPELQAQVLLLGLGALTEDVSLLAQAFSKMTDPTSGLNQEKIQILVQNRIDQRKVEGSAKLTLDLWTGWAVEQGFKLPYELVSMNRGFMILDKLLADSGSKLFMSTIMENLAKSHPRFVLQRLTQVEKVSKKKLLNVGWDQFVSLLPQLSSLRLKPPAITPITCGSVFRELR